MTAEIPSPSDRQALVEQWRNAPFSVVDYSSGKIEGNSPYEYRAGARLMMLGQEVMDLCQWSWTDATADKAFQTLNEGYSRPLGLETKRNVRVLERGFGMGLIASRIIDHLMIVGGNYTCIELNDQIAEYADTRWREVQNESARQIALMPMGGDESDAKYIPINIIRGDAFEETAKLAEKGEKFDIIISDTYPLSDEERSVNDLLDLEQLIKCLDPKGVFAFFGYHTGAQGDLNQRQRNLIDSNFDKIQITHVRVSPPPDYKYFNPPTGPLRRLPVIICTQPIIDVFNPS
ncbi:MAG: class I SAM-dependent methyltransferase [Candidatus Levyibacteriota bacterium]